LIFLIATYSTIIAGWKSIYGSSLPYFPNIDRKCSIACLVLSCLLFIIFLTSLILAGINIKVCTRKAFSRQTTGYHNLVGQGTPRMGPRTPQIARTPRPGPFR